MIDKQLRQLVLDFLDETPKAFSMSDFLSRVGEQKEVSADEIFVQRAEFFFIEHGYLTKDSTRFERAADFFTGAGFIIMPTKEETKSGKLIPGHRFLPFLKREFHPRDCALISPEGFKLAKDRTKHTLLDLGMYFSLLNEDSLSSYIQEENPDNEEIITPNNLFSQSMVFLTTFDIAGWWKKHKLARGTGMLCRVRDAEQGIFEVSPFVEAHGDKTAYIKAMDKALDKVIQKYHVSITAETQFALALYRIPKKHLLNPAMNLGAYLDITKRINDIGGMDNKTLGNGKTPQFHNFAGHISQLEKHLDILDIALSEDEIEAYMRDEHFSGSPLMDNALERCFQNRTLEFQNTEHELDFYNTLEELWNDVSNHYNVFTDRERGPLREKLLDITDSTLAFIRSIDPQPGIMEAIYEPMEELGRNTAFLGDLLNLFNIDTPLSPEDHEHLSLLSEQINQIETIHYSLIDKVQHAMESFPKRERTAEPTQFYQLKITLTGTRPPIWRRVILPGNYNLGELHSIIQIAMGWYESHLHSFEIGAATYEDPDLVDDVFEYNRSEDENAVQIDQLGLREKRSFTYTYDFGDDWEHKITLEKILDPEDAPNRDIQPVYCLKAKKACPKEDSGGISGYYNMLEILSDPDHPEFEETSEWANPDYDADFVDLDGINASLRTEFE